MISSCPSIRGLAAAACLVAVLSVVPASAQTVANPDSALAVALSSLEGEPLSLPDAVARALGHATDMLVAEADVGAAEGVLRRERGAFDPVLFGSFTAAEEETPAASPFAGADVLVDETRFTTAGARLKLPFGTELEAAVQTTRLQTNSEFAALNPQYSSVGRLSVTQPLLRGFGPAARGARTAAERDREAARARRSDTQLAVEADVVATYWDLYAAERDLAVRRVIVDQADAFLDQAQHRADAGLVGPSEVATARVFLAEQSLALIDGEERLDEASDRLGTLLGRSPRHETGRFRAMSEPPREVTVRPEDELIRTALARNGALLAARRDLDARRAEASAAGWNALPALDLVGSIGGNGLTGDAQPVVFGADTTLIDTGSGLGESVGEAVRREAPSWSVGVVLEVPIGLREGRGERDRLRAEVVRAEQRVVARERDVREEVRARHRELSHGVRRLELAREGVDASLEQVRVGLVEYENGRTTAFELVRLGADLAAAQQRYSDAVVRTAKAAAELRRLAPAELPEEES